MQASTLQALTATYRLPEQPSWRALQRHLALTSRADVLFLITPDASGASICRHALEQVLLPSKRTLCHLEPDVPNDPATLAGCLTAIPTQPSLGVLWVQLPADVPHESLPDAQAAWDRAFTALNPHRNPILQSLPAPLILAGPAWMFQSFRSHAPDWFSIRSGVFDLAGDIARSAPAREPFATRLSGPVSPPPEPDLPSPQFQFDLAPLESAAIQQALAALNPPALQLIQTLSWLDPAEPMPLWLLATHPPLPQDTEPTHALDELVKARLLQRSTDQQWLLLSSTIAKAVIHTFQNAPQRQTSLFQALEMLEKSDLGDPTNVVNWPRWNAVQAHALRLAHHAAQAQQWQPTVHWRNQVARLLNARAHYSAAEAVYREALALAQQHLPPEHDAAVAVLNNLALLLKSTNRLAEAEPMYRRALAITEKSCGPEHPNVASRLNNLAGLLYATNRLAEAEPMYRRALAINEQSYGPEHPNVATGLNNLAELLLDTNRLAEAEPMCRRALSITEKSYGPEHPTVAIRLNNLAGLLRASNRLAEAEPMFRRALAIDEKSYGPEHPEVATDLNNLAGLLWATNRLAEAEPMYRRALAIDEKSYGPEHPNVARELMNLATVLHQLGRSGEALPLIQRAVGIFHRSGEQQGYVHPHIAKAQGWLKTIQQAVG